MPTTQSQAPAPAPNLPRGLLHLIVSLLALLPLRAQNHREVLIQALTTNDTAAQISLVGQLADAKDASVAQALAAWRQGGVFLYDAGETKLPFLLDTVTSAVGKAHGLSLSTGQPLKDKAGQPLLFLPSELTPIDTTSKLRKAIKTTLDVLALSDPSAPARRDAAAKLGSQQSREYLPFLQRSLSIEEDKKVQRTLREAIASIQLISDSRQEVQAAVAVLDELRSIAALDLLVKLEGEVTAKPQKYGGDLLLSVQTARRHIQEHISFGNFVGTANRGLSTSAVLLVAALGLAITFGLMGIINMAHGEMIMIGAYSAYLSQNLFVKMFGAGTSGFNWYFVAAMPFSFVTAGLVGLVLERGIIRFLYKRPLESLLATWGVSLVLQQLMRSIFGAANVQVYSPSWLSGNITYQDVSFPYNRIFAVGFALAIVLLTWLLLTRTSVGLQVRAVMQNRQMAACMGVRIDRVNMLTFAFGSGLAGMAGVCLSQIGNIGPSLGQSHIVDCFMVVVLGGVGNLVGTITAALGIGVSTQLLEPQLGAVLGKILVLSAIILFLQWRPAGLFAQRGRSLD